MNFIDSENLNIGISEKEDGSMKSSLENRSLFFKKYNLDEKIIVSATLVHKNKIVIIDNAESNQSIPACDALITDNDKCLLTITVADCLPIYFYDKTKKVVALAHAGWRGVALNIVKEVVNTFINHYGSDLNDVNVFIGPHIQACHFEVQEDVASQFKSSDSIIRDERIYISLSKIVREQLLQLSIKDASISISKDCTHCLTNKYFSYRRDKPEELETMMAYIGLK